MKVIDVYNGIGTFDNLGNVNCHVSLPKSEKFKIKLKEIYNLKDTIFIRFDIGNNNLITNPDKEVLLWNFKIPDFDSSNPTLQYRIFICQSNDNTTISSEKASKIISDWDDTGDPKNCGNGVLTLF